MLPSKLVLGGASFGLTNDIQDAIGAIEFGMQCGIKTLDLSPSYGRVFSAESIVGACIGDTDEVDVFTKVLSRLLPNSDHSTELQRGVESSLRRLRRSKLTAVFVEASDDAGWGEMALKALLPLVADRTIGTLGLFYHDAVFRPMAVQRVFEDELGSFPIQISQNLLRQRTFVEFNNEAQIYATAALAGGLLTGKYSETRTTHGRYDLFPDFLRRTDLEKADVLHKALGDLPGGLIGVALAWVLEQPQLSATILGVRNKTQLQDCLTRVTRFREAFSEGLEGVVSETEAAQAGWTAT